ncbi:MAG: hypothetical protein RLZZ182_2699 [Pseudomonadota bacterium]|jgi:hypothetical protein
MVTHTTPPSGRAPRSAPPRPPRRDADARTLYLMPAETLRVSSTGEALVATMPDGDVRRLPVTRLLRVVCNERVHWSGAALSLCQTHGITVTWLDGRGQAQGHLWPVHMPHTDLADALHSASTLVEDWAQLYANWLRQQRLKILQGWRQQRSHAGHPVHAEEWERAKQAWVYRGDIAEHLPEVLHGMISALTAARLAADALQPEYWCADGSRLSLAEDLSRLVWAQLNLNGGAFAEALSEQREVAAVFERWSIRCADQLQVFLASLKAQAMRALHG